MHNFNREYLDIKYLSYVEAFCDQKFKDAKEALKTMNLFLPQVLVHKSYIGNLMEILNK